MYDAIVVGARCAGSPTAMLLARRGYRVLLVDRAEFPSDTLSTHYIHQPGGACLARWGLLEAVAASGCPPIERQIFDVGPFALAGVPPPADGVRAGYAPRRTLLDKILVDAAEGAGVEVRERFTVTELVDREGRVAGIRGRTAGGAVASESARIVIGADGVRSAVARQVGASVYAERPGQSFAYYAYWGDAPTEVVSLYARPERMLISAPTHAGLTLVIVYWPERELERVRADVEGEFLAALELAPELAERLRGGRRAERFRGAAGLAGFFRRPWGPGWALVGDAGYHKHPITAEGIADAFRDAERLAGAVDEVFAGRRSEAEAFTDYERRRNEAALPVYEMTCDLAQLAPPPPEMQRLFAALRDDEVEAGRFFGTLAGTVPIPEFYSPANLQRVIGAAGI